MGIVYLVLAHLFIASPLRPYIKRGFILLTFVGLFGDLLSPWLVQSVSDVTLWRYPLRGLASDRLHRLGRARGRDVGEPVRGRAPTEVSHDV